MNRLLALVMAAFVIVGCGKNSHAANPILPTVLPSSATYVLSGTVSAKRDAGEIPVEGAQIDLFDGVSHRLASTDSDGRYAVDALAAGQWSASVSKQGYGTQTAQLEVTNNASMNFELQPVAAGEGTSRGRF